MSTWGVESPHSHTQTEVDLVDVVSQHMDA